MTLADLLFNASPSLHVTDEEGRHESARLLERATRVWHSLAAGGVGNGVPVALVAENGAAFIAGLFGILTAGGTAVVVDPGLPFGPVHRVLTASRAVAVCFAGTRPRRLLEEHGGELPAPRLDLDAPGGMAPGPRPRPVVSEEQPAVILHSSGTTGAAKGIVLSHRALLSNLRAIDAYLKPSPHDVFYVARAMVHSATLVGEVLLAFASGASLLALNPRVPPTRMFQRIHEHRATIACVNPSLLRFYDSASATEQRLRSLHTLHVSGSVVDKGVFQRVHERFPWIRMINGYGLTEAGPRVAQLGTTDALKPGSVGKALQGVSLEVRRRDGSACAAHEPGEIFVRTPSLMEGYLGRDGLTRPTLVDGMLATGDLGHLDEDGDLFVTGRKDERIITGGHNVDPSEVEEAVLRVNGIADCIVFGVADALLGQRVVCAYTVDAAEAGDAAWWQRRLREACAEALASHQMPKAFCGWPDIPRGPGGKKSRLLARHRLEQGGDR